MLNDFDVNGDGELQLDEFICAMTEMKDSGAFDAADPDSDEEDDGAAADDKDSEEDDDKPPPPKPAAAAPAKPKATEKAAAADGVTWVDQVCFHRLPSPSIAFHGLPSPSHGLFSLAWARRALDVDQRGPCDVKVHLHPSNPKLLAYSVMPGGEGPPAGLRKAGFDKIKFQVDSDGHAYYEV